MISEKSIWLNLSSQKNVVRIWKFNHLVRLCPRPYTVFPVIADRNSTWICNSVNLQRNSLFSWRILPFSIFNWWFSRYNVLICVFKRVNFSSKLSIIISSRVCINLPWSLIRKAKSSPSKIIDCFSMWLLGFSINNRIIL